MYANLSKKAKFELLLLSIFNIVAFFFFAATDTLETLFKWSRTLEHLELDEILSTMFTIAFSTCFFAFSRVRESHKLILKLEAMRTRDLLTGLYNRNFIREQILAESFRAHRNGTSFSLILIEIDHFKEINEQHGQETGDDILVGVSAKLDENKRTIDYISRWGNREFLIVCPETETQEAVGITSKLLQKVRNIEFDKVGKITASFGVTSYVDEDTIECIINRVSTGLEQAKVEGKNRFITVT